MVLEGKAGAEQPDRLVASTHVIAEPCVLYGAGAEALSLLFSSPPLPLRRGALALCFLFLCHLMPESLLGCGVCCLKWCNTLHMFDSFLRLLQM